MMNVLYLLSILRTRCMYSWGIMFELFLINKKIRRVCERFGDEHTFECVCMGQGGLLLGQWGWLDVSGWVGVV